MRDDPDSHEENWGLCYLKPPVVVSSELVYETVRPSVHYTDGCASFERTNG